MGVDVGAYKNWHKEKVKYFKPKIEEIATIKSAELFEFSKLFKDNKSIANPLFLSEIFIPYGYEFQIMRQYTEEIKYYKKQMEIAKKQLATVLNENKEIFNILHNKIEDGYFILELFNENTRNQEFHFFKEFEEYEKEIWIFEEYYNNFRFPNAEVYDVFGLIKNKFNMDFFKYLICTETVEDIKDDKVNHNINNVIIDAKKVLNKINQNNNIENSYWIEEVLKECIKLWELGYKLEYDY